MNTFEQNENLLCGSQESIDLLSKKESAIILVVSDSHRNYSVMEQIFKTNPDCDAFIFCGDGISDIAQIANKALEDENLMKCVPPVWAFVQGNNDCDVHSLSNGILWKIPLLQKITICGKDFLITHGHKYSLWSGIYALDYLVQEQNAAGLFYGHTHMRDFSYSSNGGVIINPGSCSKPRDMASPAYGILEIINEKVEYSTRNL